MEYQVIDTQIAPEGKLEVLSKAVVKKLLDSSQGGLYQVFRNCALAVLNSGSVIDDGKMLLERYRSFDITVVERELALHRLVDRQPADVSGIGAVAQLQLGPGDQREIDMRGRPAARVPIAAPPTPELPQYE